MDNIINNLQGQTLKITNILQGQVANILNILHARGMDTTPYIIAYIAALVFLLFLIHKITHISFAYIFIPTALFCLAGFFFYKHKETPYHEYSKSTYVNTSGYLQLKTGIYDPVVFTVHRGDYLKYKGSKKYDYLYLGFFRNGQLYQESLIDDPDIIKTWYFWGDETIKLKSAEKPFTFKKESIEIGKLYINCCATPWEGRMRDASYYPDRFIQQSTGVAGFLKAGDTIKTNLWLDQGDRVMTYLPYGVPSDVEVKAGPMSWRSGSWDNDYPTIIDESGYLEIKALKDRVVQNIHIFRNHKTSFYLSPGEVKKIQIFKKDVVVFRNSSRVYFEGALNEPGNYEYTHKNNDGFLEFKGSLFGGEVSVNYKKRQGI